jgi:hypothetical protein
MKEELQMRPRIIKTVQCFVFKDILLIDFSARIV